MFHVFFFSCVSGGGKGEAALCCRTISAPGEEGQSSDDSLETCMRGEGRVFKDVT